MSARRMRTRSNSGQFADGCYARLQAGGLPGIGVRVLDDLPAFGFEKVPALSLTGGDNGNPCSDGVVFQQAGRVADDGASAELCL